MLQTRKIPITELNDYLTCKLCKGYYIDATTIIECLHTFCRGCIVQYLKNNKYCPICDVQVHKTKPLLNIRPDKTLQDIVYKLVPRLFQNEMCRRREFYSSHPEARPSKLEQCGEVSYQHILSPDEMICISLNHYGHNGAPRYLRCPAAVSVTHLQKLIRAKYDLRTDHRIDVLHNQDCLNAHLTLMDIAYIYLWRRKGPLELTYRIYENRTKRMKLESGKDAKEDPSEMGNEWKEVQLRISESGEMCVTGVDNSTILNEEIAKGNMVEMNTEEAPAPKKQVPGLRPINRAVSDKSDNNVKVTSDTSTSGTSGSFTSVATSTGSETTCTYSAQSSVTSCAVTSNENKTKSAVTSEENKAESDKQVKRKSSTEGTCEPPLKQSKPMILNHSLGLQSHALKRTLKNTENDGKQDHPPIKTSCSSTNVIIRSVTTIVPAPNATLVPSTSSSSKPIIINKSYAPTRPTVSAKKWPSKTGAVTVPCYTPKTTFCSVLNVPRVSTNVLNDSKPTTSAIISNKVVETDSCKSAINLNKSVGKSAVKSPAGYKTLRSPPKSWNAQISKANVPKNVEDGKNSDAINARPAKFFKVRNNMPRYLGNPASGVKPLYQVHASPEKDDKGGSEGKVKPEKMEIKKHSIVKIDPKTLKPISEKAPETTSLSNQSDLKINTSSVPIFNPLKLQSSPKNERKSPKSPHSPPKLKTSSPTSKRDKLNLNFTPSNPFVPNLTSPTLNPNQFLYSAMPPGFPAYDPRVFAAYHNLLYSQGLTFPPNPVPRLNLDMNQRKCYDVPSPGSPKLSSVSCVTSSENMLYSCPKMSSQTSPRLSDVKSSAMSSPVNQNHAKNYTIASMSLAHSKSLTSVSSANRVSSVSKINEHNFCKPTVKSVNSVSKDQKVNMEDQKCYQNITKSVDMKPESTRPINSSSSDHKTDVLNSELGQTLPKNKVKNNLKKGVNKDNGKSEKSLENTVEKLTQNKNKEKENNDTNESNKKCKDDEKNENKVNDRLEVDSGDNKVEKSEIMNGRVGPNGSLEPKQGEEKDNNEGPDPNGNLPVKKLTESRNCDETSEETAAEKTLQTKTESKDTENNNGNLVVQTDSKN